MSHRSNGSDRRLARRLRRRRYRLTEIETRARVHEFGLAAPGAVPTDETQKLIEQLRDQLLRKQAEFENFRKRTQRDQAQKIELGNKDLVEQLLPVLDNFERAIATPGESVDALLSGIRMVQKQFLDALGAGGLEKIESQGQPFDPNLHEAVTAGPAEDLPENHIAEVFQEGYTLKGKLLRPAMVKVARD